jgi:ribose transport system substrate-binding protein
MDAGIPVVAIDTGVSGADVTSFVATDNLAVATIQGEQACGLIDNGDAVIYVTGNQAQSTGQERRDGFYAGFEGSCSDSEIVVVPTEWNGTQAQEGVAAVLATRSDITMIVNAWDGGTMGAKAALQNAGYSAGDVKLVGFDGATDAILAMDEGWVHVDTAQMLEGMGYHGIRIAAEAANGNDVPGRYDTGTFLVTPDTSAEYKALIGM